MPRYTREGRNILDRGKLIVSVHRELDANANCPITPRQCDLLVERMVQLLNRQLIRKQGK